MLSPFVEGGCIGSALASSEVASMVPACLRCSTTMNR